MIKLVVREKEIVEAIDKVNSWLNDKNKERETGEPMLPSWAVPADQFMPSGR